MIRIPCRCDQSHAPARARPEPPRVCRLRAAGTFGLLGGCRPPRSGSARPAAKPPILASPGPWRRSEDVALRQYRLFAETRCGPGLPRSLPPSADAGDAQALRGQRCRGASVRRPHRRGRRMLTRRRAGNPGRRPRTGVPRCQQPGKVLDLRRTWPGGSRCHRQGDQRTGAKRMSLFSWRFLPIASKAARADSGIAKSTGKMTQRSAVSSAKSSRQYVHAFVRLREPGSRGNAHEPVPERPAVMIDRGSRIDVALPGQSASLPSDFVLPLRGKPQWRASNTQAPASSGSKVRKWISSSCARSAPRAWGRRAGRNLRRPRGDTGRKSSRLAAGVFGARRTRPQGRRDRGGPRSPCQRAGSFSARIHVLPVGGILRRSVRPRRTSMGPRVARNVHRREPAHGRKYRGHRDPFRGHSPCPVIS